MKKVLIILLLSVTYPFCQTKVGSTAAPFLNIAVSPRAISMGGAFVATANDVSSLYWNPAGASRSDINEAMFSHSRWFADINYNWAGAMIKPPPAPIQPVIRPAPRPIRMDTTKIMLA